MGYSEKVIISWDRLAQDCRTLSEKIKEQGNVPDKILAVTRGGLVVAGLVCRALDIKDIETIGLETYHVQTQTGDIQVLKHPDPSYLSNALILDDLVDTGQTFEYLKEQTTGCIFACLYAKPKGREFTDIYVCDFAQDQWIENPWETFENN